MWENLTAIVFGIFAAFGSIFSPSPSVVDDYAVMDNQNVKRLENQQINETTNAKAPEIAEQTEERKEETQAEEENAQLIDISKHEKQDKGNIQDANGGGNVAVLVDK